MSATAAFDPARLAELVVSSAASEYAANGMHHRHVADPGRIVALAEAFREAGYVLEMLSCSDRRFVEAGDDAAAGAMDAAPSMRLTYTFNRFMDAAGTSAAAPDRHLVIVDLPPEIPGAEAPSLVSVYAGADWFEREVFDMYGVRFAGHPDLKRILLPDDADFHALLKDFGRIEDAPDDGGGDEAEDGGEAS